MKTYLNLLFFSGLLLSQALIAGDQGVSYPGDDQKVIANDSATDLSGKQLLDGVDPNQYHDDGFTGYGFLKGRKAIIEYSMASTKLSGDKRLIVKFDVMVNSSGELDFSLLAHTNSGTTDPDRIGGYNLGVTNETTFSGAPFYVGSSSPGLDYYIYSPGHYPTLRTKTFSSEAIVLGDLVTARATPAGISLNINDKHLGLFYNAFCPWSKDINRPNVSCYISSAGSRVYHTGAGFAALEVTP